MVRIAGNRMLRARRQVREVMRSQSLNLILVVQHTRPFHDEINLLLALVEDGLAIAIPIQRDFAETSDGLEGSIFFVSLAENSSIVASWRGEIGFGLGKIGNVAIQPCGVRLMLLRSEPMCQQQQEQQGFSHVRCSRLDLGFISGPQEILPNQLYYPALSDYVALKREHPDNAAHENLV